MTTKKKNEEVLKELEKIIQNSSSAESQLKMLCHGVTDMQNPQSILNTAAILFNTSMQMYSMVLAKEDIEEIIMWAHDRVSNSLDETIYH